MDTTTDLGIFEEVRKLGPYLDPLGLGSLQPDPRARRRDAHSRILRNLRDQETRLDARRSALEAVRDLVETTQDLEALEHLLGRVEARRRQLLAHADRQLAELEAAPDIPASRERISAWIEHLEAQGRYGQAAKYCEHLDEL